MTEKTAIDTQYEQARRCYEAADYPKAREYFEAIVGQEPSHVGALAGLGMACWSSHLYEEALVFLERVLTLAPRDESAIRGMCLTLLSLDQVPRARDFVDSLKNYRIEQPSTMLLIGLVRHRSGNLDEAERWYQKAISIQPRYSEAYNNWGNVMLDRNAKHQARELYMRALLCNPANAEACRNLAILLSEQGSGIEAIALLRRGLAHHPRSVPLFMQIGSVLRELGKTELAIEAYEEALRGVPDALEPLHGLSIVLNHQGEQDQGYEVCDRILRRDSMNVGVRFRKVTTLPGIMDSYEAIREARERYEAGLKELAEIPVSQGDPIADVNTAHFYLAYHGLNERRNQEALAGLYRAKFPRLSFVAPHTQERRKDGKFRVGVCSRHWGEHTIGVLFSDLFARLKRDDFELCVFNTVADRMPPSPAILERADVVCRLPVDLNPAQQIVAAERLDALIYPDIGMEPFTYFMAFARLARSQCVLWGHPLTTGISTMDCFLSARDLEIEDAAEHYSERLIRLPTLNTYYQRPVAPPQITKNYFKIPTERTWYICPQTLFKFHPDFDPMLTEILEADPNGILVLLEGTHKTHAPRLTERLRRTMPGLLDRVFILPRLTGAEFLGLVAVGDVMLDTTHFGGGSTTIQALSFGTPVVTLPGEFLRGRISQACYRAMGEERFVVKDSSEYVRRAIELGRDPVAREEIRRDLRTRSDALFENEAVVHEFEDFIRAEVSARD